MDKLPAFPRVYKHEWFTVDLEQVDAVVIYSRSGVLADNKTLPYEVKVFMSSGAIMSYCMTEQHAKDFSAAFEGYAVMHETVH